MTREALLAEIDAAVLNTDRASPAIDAYRALETRLRVGIPGDLAREEVPKARQEALHQEAEGLTQLRAALRLDIGYVEFHVATCCYKILRTFENLTAFRKRAAKLPRRCF